MVSTKDLLRGRNTTAAVRGAGQTAAAASPATDVLFGLPGGMLRLIELPLDQIHQNPDQPRKSFPEAEIADLASSIEQFGLKQPIGVKPIGDRQYQLVFGERRLRAHQLLNRPTITATISSGDIRVTALLENTQRADLNAVELAFSLHELLSEFTQVELARIAGLNPAIVSRLLKLVSLPPQILTEFRVRADAGAAMLISRTTMLEIAAASTTEEQLRLWDMAKAGGQSRDIEATRKGRGGDPAPPDANNHDNAEAGDPIAVGARLRVAKAVSRLGRDVTTLASHAKSLSSEDRAQLEAIRAQIETVLSSP